VNDAQTWTIIGGFFALMVTMISLTLRTVRAEMRAEIGGLRAEMNGRFDTVDARLNHLDRDVQAGVTRLMEG
jgi:hypothetical protein